MNSPHPAPRPYLRFFLYLATGLATGAYLLSHPGVEALAVLALFALWVFLGIPACCGFRK